MRNIDKASGRTQIFRKISCTDQRARFTFRLAKGTQARKKQQYEHETGCCGRSMVGAALENIHCKSAVRSRFLSAHSPSSSYDSFPTSSFPYYFQSGPLNLSFLEWIELNVPVIPWQSSRQLSFAKMGILLEGQYHRPTLSACLVWIETPTHPCRTLHTRLV